MDALYLLRKKQAMKTAFIQNLATRHTNDFNQVKRWYEHRKEDDLMTYKYPEPKEPQKGTEEYGSNEAWDVYNEAWFKWKNGKDFHKERGVRPEDRDKLKEVYEKYDLRVRLRVHPLPPEEEKYQITAKNGELLQIYTEPNPKDEFFEMAFKKVDGANPYHLSLCYTNELHRFNLFNFSDGVRRGKEVYQRIINKFDGKEAFLRGYMTNSSAFNVQYIIMPDMIVNIDEEEDMNAMHKAGEYQGRDWHISM